MRVGFDASSLRTRRDGVGSYTENIIRGLSKHAPDVELILFSHRTPRFQTGATPNLPVRLSGSAATRDEWFKNELPLQLEKANLDLCHFPNMETPAAASCPVVVTVHDMALLRHPTFFPVSRRQASKSRIGRVAERASAIITVSNFSRRELLTLATFPPDRVYVVPEAANETFMRPMAFDRLDMIKAKHALPDRFVLCVGTIEERKNQERLITAFEHLVSSGPGFRDLHLVLVGRYGYRSQRVERRLAPFIDSGRVRVIHHVSFEELRAIYRIATVLAHPSLYEGFGLPILEAMSSGLPVLTSGTTATGEVAGNAALLIDPLDTVDIARGLRRLLTEPHLARDLADRGRARALTFSWDKAAAETLSVYNDILREPGRSVRRSIARARSDAGQAHPPELADAPAAVEPPPSALARAILCTILYADLFDFPLTVNELHHDLIGVSTSRADLIATLLRNPWLKGRVLIQDGFICLQGRGHLVARRRTQTRLTDQFLADQRGLLERLGHLPFVRMLAFSGARSRRRSTHALGLDLFIICAKRRACTTYALAMLTARLHRRRSFVGGIDVVDTAHLRAWNRGDLFTGHELLHLRPLSGEGMRRVLLDQNDWVFDRFPNARGADALGPWPRSRFGQRVKRAVELGLWPLWECVEWASRAIVSWRYRRRAGGLKRAGARAHGGAVRLHLGDFGARMMERFRKRLRAEGVWDPELSRELAKRGQRVAEARDEATKRNVHTDTSTESASNTAPVD